MSIIDNVLAKLNKDQIKPVLDTEGAVLVIAGAGSGKTRVLTSRIAYLLAEKKVSPYEILAITFTNKAADEMKIRLQDLCGDISAMWVSTIHSLCVKILRGNIEKLGYDKNFTIYDDTDKEKVLKRVIEDLTFESDKLLKPVKAHISNAKNDCLSPEEYKEEYSSFNNVEKYYEIYKEYQKRLEQSNAVDFDDLLFLTYKLFKKYPEIADNYSERFRYVHIDEFQDTNRVQFEIAEMLAKVHGNLFVVGDDDQSIYGWRGAKIENILNFDKIYRGAKIYRLEQNYRSTKKILELANCIIEKNKARRSKKLWTENPDGEKIEFFVGRDEQAEASYVSMMIKSMVMRGAKYSDFAVFMRINAISRAFEQEFAKYGIPYKVFGGFRFFERKEIKDVLSYLKLINNPFDDESFLRSISVPRRGIGDKSLQELREYAVSKGLSMFDAIDFLGNSDISNATKKKLFNYKNLIEEFAAYSETHTVPETMDFILASTGFMEQFAENTEEDVSKKYNIAELKNSAQLFVKDNQGSTLSDYLNAVTLSSDTDDINNENVVTLATIHSVKGLEYENVFVAGLDEKILPILRNGEEDLEEERRLMYVAVTRAKNKLFLTRAESRYMYGGREHMMQSRFLTDAGDTLGIVKPKPTRTWDNGYNHSDYKTRTDFNKKYQDNGYGQTYQEDDGYSSTFSFSSGSANKYVEGAKPVKQSGNSIYKTGMKVRHKKFGEGVVIMVKNSGENTVVDVAFKGVGIKTLAVKFAPLEKI